MKLFPFALLLCLLLAVPSCSKGPDGPALHHVEGQVLWNGTPASGAVVILHRVGDSAGEFPRPRGKTQENGRFALSTFSAEDGAPAGEYVVTVEWKRFDDHPEQGIDLLPAAYADPKSSKLRTTVDAGTNDPLVLRLPAVP